MIANITQSAILKPLLQYNNNKVKSKDATLLEVANVLSNNLELAQKMISNLGFNSTRKDKFFHVSLNFPTQDISILNDDLLKKIAQDYLCGLNFDNQHPYLVYKHEDTLHPHIHIVTSKILSSGKSINDSNLKYKSQKLTRELEIKYSLTQVSSQKTTISKDFNTELTEGSGLKEKLDFHLNFAIKVLKVQSMRQLQVYLNENNLDYTYVARINEIEGKPHFFDGFVFNNINADFKQNQRGIKASSLNLKPTQKNLDKLFAKNKQEYSFKKDCIKDALNLILSKYDSISLDDLTVKLLENNIAINFKKDSNNRFVGVSYTDVNDGYKFTGENIGKEFTAKNISAFIGEKTQIKPSVITRALYFKYKSIIANSTNQLDEINNLIKLGFNVQFANNNLYISDYKNTLPKDFVLYRKNIQNLTSESIQLVKNSYQINFNKLTEVDVLTFRHNRARAENDIPTMNSFRQKIESLNNIENNVVSNNKISSNIDELFNDIVVAQETDDNFNENSISDVDKKKRKNIFKKRKM